MDNTGTGIVSGPVILIVHPICSQSFSSLKYHVCKMYLTGVRPVVRGFICPRVHLSEVPGLALGLWSGQDIPEHLWGSDFFAVWMTLDDPNPNTNTNPQTSGPSDN